MSKSTEIIRFQAKMAMDLYEQTSDVLQSATDAQQIELALQQIQEKCKRLAIYGIITAKDQESEAKLYATKAMDLPPSLKHLEHADDDTKATIAFDDEFIQMVEKAKWEHSLLQQRGGSNNRGGRGNGGDQYRRGGRRQFRSRGSSRGSFFGQGPHTNRWNQSQQQSNQQPPNPQNQQQ